MSNAPRLAIGTTTSTFTRAQRVLIVTLGFILVLGGVAISKSPALRTTLGFAPAAKPPVAQQPGLQADATRKSGLLRIVGVNRGWKQPSSLARPLAPSILATKTDSLFTDVDGDLQADPGDTLKYTVSINAGGEDATGVSFTDTVDPNTTFVPGSLMATPVAADDSYAALGNVRISVPAPGVLGNDFTGVPSATITAAPTSTAGGNVAVNPDGSFTYNPPAGFEGTDTFSYTLTNAAGSNSATVTITVSGMIWFINNTASCPCDGRLTNPFNTLGSFAAVNNGVGNNPAANDNIFLYESAVDYVGPVTLLNGQRFIGQDSTASLSAITGLTPPTYSDPLPTMNSGNAIIVNITSLGNSINVVSGNLLRGFTGGNSLSDISGSSFGTLTIADVTLNGTGQALNLTTGTLAATFISISSTASTTTGISLTSVLGSLTSPSTTITNPVGIGLSVNTSGASLDFGNTSSTLSGGTGVSLTTNTGAITFGALNITPDPGQQALLATDNTSTITSTSGAITTSAANAVEITRGVGTTPLVISLTSVSQTGGTLGIRLSNTSGSFTVAGSGGTCTFAVPTCSGGRITTTTGADDTTDGIGVSLNNVTNITLTSMRLDDHPNFAIRGNGVVGFTLQSSVVDGENGTSATADLDLVDGEDSIRIINLTGSALIDDSFIGGGYEHNLRIVNNTGTLNRLTVSDTSIGDLDGAGPGRGVDTTDGDDNVLFAAFEGITQMNATFTNNILNNGKGNVFQANNDDINAPVGSMDVVFRNNKVTNNHPDIVTAGGGVTFDGVGGMTYDISCNSFRDSQGIGLNVFKQKPTNGQTGGTWSGTIFNNTVGVTGVPDSGGLGSGINVEAQGNGTHTSLIKNNEIRNHNEAGIRMSVVDANTSAPTAVTLNATVIGNLVAEASALGGFTGFYALQGAVPGADANSTLNLKLGGAGAEQNDFTDGDPMDFNDVFMVQGAFPDGVFNLTQGNSTSFVPDTVVMDNNVSPITVFTDGVTVVLAVPALPAATDQTCAPPLRPAPETSKPLVQSDSEATTGISKTLRSASGENQNSDYVQRLTPSDLQVMTQAAILEWSNAGASAEEIARMQAVSLEIADLSDGQLATANDKLIQIDVTAAGFGWYVDATPSDNSEFDVPVPNREMQSSEFSFAHGRMDLLTVIMRQLGTFRTDRKSRANAAQRWLMQNTIGTGIRRAPVLKSPQRVQPELSKTVGSEPAVAETQSLNQPVKPTRKNEQKSTRRSATGQTILSHHAIGRRSMANNARPSVSSMLADVSLSIGTLPAGETVVITFNVTVNNPFMGALPQVSNQGTVSGSNFSDVLTDDPTVGGTADPTVTPIDLPEVTVAVSPGSVAEDGATNLVYTFTRDGSTANAMTVNFSIGGSADFGASPDDYTQTGAATFTPPTGTVTFSPGSATATVTVNPEADTTVEPDETVSLTVTSGIGYVVGSPSSASGTITNDDTDVSVAVSPASVTEDGATNLVYTFTRVGVTTNALTVNFSIAVGGNNAVFPVDYSQSGAATFAPPVGTVTFGAGNSTATVTVDPTSDSIVEPDETVIFTVTSGAGYNVGSPGSATGTITNEDSDVSVTVAPSSATEDGATNLVYTFTRTGFTLVPVTVNFSVGGTAVFSEPDYTQTGAATYSDTSGTVVFGAGASTATVTIDPSPDLTVEPDETVILTVTSGTGYNVGSPDSATGTITNDDTDVSVAVSPGSVAEDGATNLVYTFTRNGVTSGAMTVNFSVGGSASFGASPNDYTQTGATTYTSTSGTVTFTAGNSTATVTVNPETDNTVELDETVDLTVTAGAGYNVGSPSAVSGTITNDDTDVSVVVAPASVAEDGATNLVYTFTRNGVTSGAMTVNFSVGGSASFGASPNDYTQTGATTYTSTSGTVTFTAGGSTATVTVNPETDTTIETDETVILTVTSGAGYNVSSPSSATGTITNDDADVSVVVAPASVAEDGATNLVYTFTRTGFTAGALTVNFSVGGTATFGVTPDDYTQTGATTYTTTSGSVTFAPGSPTAMVTVNPETDTTAEPDETVIITLTAGASYNAVSPNSATGTILNDDTLVSVVVAPSSTAEGGANLVYTFSRTGPTTSALTVNFSVGGSASFPADYTQSGATTFTPPTATVTFAAGSSITTISVTPLTDCAVEGSETVVFTVQPGAGYGVGSPSSATGTITNTPDSTAPTITLIPNVNKTLWPPNHQYESITVTDFVASASDNCDPSVNINSVYILKISSDEAENGSGDGNTLNDIVIGATCKTAQLRSERAGNGNGRVYTITFKVKDSFGNFTTATAKVTVRHSPNNPAVDSGTAYTVNSVCP